MTRYKQYMKEKYDYEFDEDFEFLPYPYDSYVTLETRDVTPTRYGLILVSVYNVDVARSIYLPDGSIMGIYEEDEELNGNAPAEIRIYNELPHYAFMFDYDDNLIAVRHSYKSFID